jgi:hypothetical protein
LFTFVFVFLTDSLKTPNRVLKVVLVHTNTKYFMKIDDNRLFYDNMRLYPDKIQISKAVFPRQPTVLNGLLENCKKYKNNRWFPVLNKAKKKKSTKLIFYKQCQNTRWKHYFIEEKKYSSPFSIWPTSPLHLLVSVLMVRNYISLFLSYKNEYIVTLYNNNLLFSYVVT